MMKLLFLCMLLTCCATTSTAKPWHGITPGVTSRAEVVRLLGRCADPLTQCRFTENGEEIRLVFSGNAVSDLYDCAKTLSADTVLLIEVTPVTPIPLKRLRLGRSLKPLGPTSLGFRGYVDEQIGLVLKTYKGKVIELNYVASKTDKYRCADYYKNPRDFIQVITHCPPVSLEGPGGTVTAGNKITFRANVVQDPKMTLSWFLSAGRIIGDQNTRTILVDTTGLGGQKLKVVVQARGSCSVETSYEVRVSP